MTMKGNSQFYIFNLFANFIRPRHRPVWTNELIQLMRALKITEKTTRSTLARMTQRGWLNVEKVGRQSRYALSKQGLTIIQAGDVRIFEPPPAAWDGRWHLFTYSLPDRLAQLRTPLAKRLRWIGYGNLNHGTWVSPINRISQIQPTIIDLGVAPYTLHFTNADKAGPMSDKALVDHCWDLNAVAQRYQDFVDEFQPLYHAQRATSSEQAFQRYFWLSQAFQKFPRLDPNLPPVLLPAGWIGFRARDLFTTYRASLEQHMQPFLDEILGAEILLRPQRLS